VVGGESGTMADSLFISQEIGFANFQKKNYFYFFVNEFGVMDV
jgi:hypothetical protein